MVTSGVELTFQIAGVAIRTVGCGVGLSPGDAYGAFAVGHSYTNPEIQLCVRVDRVSSIPSGEVLFQSEGVWELRSSNDGYAIIVSPPGHRYRPKWIVSLKQDFRSGEALLCVPEPNPNTVESASRSSRPVVLPLDYPFDQILVASYLARGMGAILHACGVVDEGKGILFCGVSGAGKSTMANIWKPTYATLLSDDRIIVRRMDGVFRMYGTPWHGDANVCDPGNAPLEKVFFIVHADRNYAKPISPIDAASRLLVRCFPPFWDKDGMEFVTNFLAEVAEEVPCYELGFVPDQSVVEFVRSIE